MKMLKIIYNSLIIFFILVICLVVFNGATQAATLNLGEEVYRFKALWFDSNQDDYLLLDLGYGLDQYSGLGIRLIAPDDSNRGIIDLDYQYIPEDLRDNSTDFNYAFKIGASNGTILAEEFAVKGGFIIENEHDYNKFYLDANIYLASFALSVEDMMAIIEFGISRELSPGIDAVFGYKAVATPEEDVGTISGVKYGFEIKF